MGDALAGLTDDPEALESSPLSWMSTEKELPTYKYEHVTTERGMAVYGSGSPEPRTLLNLLEGKKGVSLG